MTQLVCQQCEQTIGYMFGEKVDVLYGQCTSCSQDENDSDAE
ncbi:GapA-binding peptide SR1P [Peribacillus simplex]|uniref:GapA-binding peptide SR1P n=1 Tax=Peribacillus frigoritolerans TaxID=450367 RepID=A0AAJ1QIE7_9BACI|nr:MULTISPECIES: GapA-binding peptide SR1P [Peribacillus]MBD8591411.1 GapA-binding peptide SR1P [Peribacillus simplex]MDM5281942.1 GapA-binding peptide SR1P [Peribacillus frigoritolerans]NCT39696.1 GapA-binding peptide SR1P [Peribacillus frigoritolerans]